MRSRGHSRRLLLVLLGVLIVIGVAGTAVYAASATKTDFSLGINPTSQSVQQGQSVTYTVTATGSGGFAGSIPLSVSGLPTGATASFSPATLTLSSTIPTATSTLIVTTAKNTPTGSAALTVNGASGNLKRSVTATLSVTYPLNGSYSLSASPSAVSVAPGTTAISTVTVSRVSPFAGAISFAAGSLPAGVTASFNPATTPAAAGSSTSSLSLATSTSTANGSYTVPVISAYTNPATGQSYYAYTQLQLTVDSKLSAKQFSLTGNITAKLAPGMAPQPINLAISNPNQQALGVTNLTVTLSGTSAGSSCDASNFAVTQYSGPYPLTVPTGGTSTLSGLGQPSTVWPKLQMLDLPRNQDGCKSVTINLGYSGTAQGN